MIKLRPELGLILLLLVCCGAPLLISLGGVGMVGGILSGQGLLVTMGLAILVLGVYFYFRRRK